MAIRVETHLVCDLDNLEAKGTVAFKREGVEFEIDLCEDHLEEYGAFTLIYAQKARRPAVSAARRRRGPSTPSRDDKSEIRTWAREHGFNVSDRGRIPFAVTEAFDGRG